MSVAPDVSYCPSDHLFIRRLGVDVPVEHPVTMRLIAERVCARHGLSLKEIRSSTRARYVARPRQEAMWQMRQVKRDDGRCRYSYQKIAQFFGLRDHTTVLKGARFHAKRMEQDA